MFNVKRKRLKLEEKKDILLKLLFEIGKEYNAYNVQLLTNKLISNNKNFTQKEIQDFIEILIFDGNADPIYGITPKGKDFYLKGGYQIDNKINHNEPNWLKKVLITAIIGGIITVLIKLSPYLINHISQNHSVNLEGISASDTIITKISPSAMENPENNEFEILKQERTYDLREASNNKINKPVTCYEYFQIIKKSPANEFKFQYASSGYIQFQKDTNIKAVYVHNKLNPDSSYTLKNYHVHYDVSKDTVGQRKEIWYTLKYYNTFFTLPKCGLGDCINLKVLKKIKKLTLSIYYNSNTFGGKFERYYSKYVGNDFKEFMYTKNDIKNSTNDSVLIWNISELLPPPVNYKITYNYKEEKK